MAFIRIKRRKKGEEYCEYAYLVENTWLKTRKQASQRVQKYLGKVYRPQKIAREFSCEPKSSFYDIVKEIIRWELGQHLIDSIEVDLEGCKVTDKNTGKQCVVAINDGYLCGETLAGLLQIEKKREEKQGYMLAKALVDAGIQPPREVFVVLYEKLNKR